MREVCGAKRAISGLAINGAVFGADIVVMEAERLFDQVGPVSDHEMLVITIQRYTKCDVEGCTAHGG